MKQVDLLKPQYFQKLILAKTLFYVAVIHGRINNFFILIPLHCQASETNFT